MLLTAHDAGAAEGNKASRQAELTNNHHAHACMLMPVRCAHQVLPTYASSTHGIAASPLAAGSPGQSPLGPFSTSRVPAAGPLGRKLSPAFSLTNPHAPATPQSVVRAAIDRLQEDGSTPQVLALHGKLLRVLSSLHHSALAGTKLCLGKELLGEMSSAEKSVMRTLT